MYQVPMPPNRPTPNKSILLAGLVILLLHKLTKKK